jgi:hypothetical protein
LVLAYRAANARVCDGPISAYASGFVDEREMPDQMDSAEAAHRRFIAKMFRTLPVTARSC